MYLFAARRMEMLFFELFSAIFAHLESTLLAVEARGISVEAFGAEVAVENELLLVG